MADKISHDEFYARGASKLEAGNNLEKAKAALAAAFVGGRAFAQSFCSFRRAAPAFLLCIANPLVVRAEQLFERAGVTKTINAVSVLPRNTKAVPGDVITKDLALKTGGDSRAELEFRAPIARVQPWDRHLGGSLVTMTMGRKLMRGDSGQRAWIFTIRKKSSIRQRIAQLPSTSPDNMPTTAENRL